MKFASVVTTALAIVGASAVFKDEAYKVDWQRENVGILKSGKLVDPVLVVESDRHVVAGISVEDGTVTWRRLFDEQATIHTSYSDDKVAVTLVKGDEAQLLVLDSSTGVLNFDVRKTSKNSHAAINGDDVYLSTGEKVYRYDSKGDEVWSSDLSGDVVGSVNLKDAAGFLVGGSALSLAVIKDNLVSSHKIEGGKPEIVSVVDKYLLTKKGSDYTLYELGSNGVQRSSSHAVPGNELHLRVESDSVKVIETNGKEVVHSLDAFTKPIESKTVPELLSFNIGNGGYIIQLGNGQIKSSNGWVREEGLTTAKHAVFVDLPELSTSLSEEEILFEEHAGIIPAFVRRTTRHVADFIKFIHRIQYPKEADEEKATAHGDVFGFRKFFVVATETGRLVALDTHDGSTAWALEPIPRNIVDVTTIGEVVYVVSRDGDVIKVDGLTGNIIERSKPNVEIEQMLFNANSNPKGIGAFSNQGVVEIDGDLSHEIYFATHDSQNVYGHFGNSKTWTFSEGEHYEIKQIAKRHQDDVTASIGTILGDRRVLYKYLHPNSIAVAAVSKSGALKITLLDVVTGRILHSKIHNEGVDPQSVSLIYGEHWIVYAYQSNKGSAIPKIVVWDLYESETPNERLSPDQYSSFDSFAAPFVFAQSFFPPARVKSLAVTRTKFGVTNRDIVLNLDNGQIMSLPKRILDARRPVDRDPTKIEQEEGLLKYDPAIGLEPHVVITHSRQAFVERITTQPASLESTSLIGGWGLDTFFTRVAPSQPFDILNSGFAKKKLLLTMGALAGAVFVLKPMVAKRSVNLKWA